MKAGLESGRPSMTVVEVDGDALYSFRRNSFAHRTLINPEPEKPS